MLIIKTTEALSAFCTALGNDRFVTVDTEFMREKTYWPELCLIQIAGAETDAIIDPLAPDLDLTPFFDLMNDERILKVFHAARQDLEIIHLLSGKIPHPLFDTQVAAMVCGFGDQIGYEPIVRKLAGAEIDKSSRFTDWSRRPLSDKQLAYALSDVTHLRVVYEKLKVLLDKSGREGWLEEEMDVLTSPATYINDPKDAWKRVKFRPRKKRQLAVLIELAKWRESEAQRRNIPRNRILKDDAIGELAVQAPKDESALTNLRALPRGFSNSQFATDVIAAVTQGVSGDQSRLPEIEEPRGRPPEGAGAIADILKLALKVISDQEGIAPRLIATSSDIEKIAANSGHDLAIFKGWRNKVFGSVARDLMAGACAIGLQDGKTAIVPIKRPGGLKAAE